jgi:FKBP-type peptidyl-prolyl cis-trans isomerase 2
LTVEGQVVDSTEGKAPLHYIHGRKQLIPGLERALAGMHVGESKTVTVAPEDAYGQPDPAAVMEISKTQLPQDVTPTVGMTLGGMSPEGQPIQAQVVEVKADTVVLDINHPLAGKTLNFNVKVTDLEPAPSPEPAANP